MPIPGGSRANLILPIREGLPTIHSGCAEFDSNSTLQWPFSLRASYLQSELRYFTFSTEGEWFACQQGAPVPQTPAP